MLILKASAAPGIFGLKLSGKFGTGNWLSGERGIGRAILAIFSVKTARIGKPAAPYFIIPIQFLSLTSKKQLIVGE